MFPPQTLIKLKRYEVLEKEEFDNKIVIWPDLPYWIYVTPETVEILNVIDGEIYENILQKIWKKLGLQIEEKELLDFLELLKLANVLESENFLNHEKRTEEDNFNFLIRYITLNITDKCNLFCKHCYIEASNKKTEYLSFDDAKKIIDSISCFMINGCNIIVSGGEAILNPDCINIMRYINFKGKGKITLVSNGTLFTDKMIEELKTINGLSVQISLDGFSKKVHESIRGKDTYEKTIQSIKKLRSNNIQVYLSPMVTEPFFEEIEEYFSLAKELGAISVFLQPVNSVGRAKKNNIKRVNDAKVFRKIVELYKKDPELEKYVPGTLEMKYLASIHLLEKCHYCGTGSGSIAIQPNGDFYPCPNTICSELKIGNILTDDFSKLWLNSPVLCKLRGLNVNTNLNEKCSECCVKLFCGGGCRGVALQNSGDIHALSISCEYEKEQRIEMLWTAATNTDLFKNEINRIFKNLELLSKDQEETRIELKEKGVI